MVGFRRDLFFDAELVTIHDWEQCLLSTAPVTSMQRLVKEDGTSRKSEVDAEVLDRGDGHLSAWELYVFVSGGSSAKAHRMTTGLTVHTKGGKRKELHVYLRELPKNLVVSSAEASRMLNSAADKLQALARCRQHAMDVLPPPSPPPPPAIALPRTVPPAPAFVCGCGKDNAARGACGRGCVAPGIRDDHCT